MRKQTMLILILSLFAVTIWAATNSVPSAVPDIKKEASNLLLAVIPLLVPIIVAGFKVVLKFIPSWSLPIIAAGLGELLNFVSGLVGGPTTSVLGGVLLGSAGTGLREIVDQVKQVKSGEKTA